MQDGDTKNTNAAIEVEISNPEPEFYIRKSKSSKYIVEYHLDMCIGAASCAAIAPGTFVMNEENKAVFTEGEKISEDDTKVVYRFENVDDDDAILAAAQSCPVFAIIVKDAETGEQIFPPEGF